MNDFYWFVLFAGFGVVAFSIAALLLEKARTEHDVNRRDQEAHEERMSSEAYRR